uniref:Uncharacterized protein n=1 Tax=Zea mays TaxID=4577 RepID=C0PBE4_MAIZE|nr:unknown [Zea mays]
MQLSPESVTEGCAITVCDTLCTSSHNSSAMRPLSGYACSIWSLGHVHKSPAYRSHKHGPSAVPRPGKYCQSNADEMYPGDYN